MSDAVVPTGDLCDAHKADTDADLTSGRFRVLAPRYRSFGARTAFAGPVRTVRCHEDNTSVKALLESPGDGQVLVVDGGGSLRRALVGGNIAAAAAKNGWAGVLVHGAVRDLAELAVADVGLLALAPVPMPTERKHAGEVDVPVQLDGVWVRPGDWLVADIDGVVVMDRRP